MSIVNEAGLRGLFLLIVVAGAASAAPPVEDPFAPERLEALVAPAIADWEPVTGAPFGEAVEIRIVDRAGMAESLVRDIEPQMRRVYGDGVSGLFHGSGEQLANVLGGALLARYDFRDRVVLVCPENFRGLSERFESPELLTEGMIRQVMVHEMVHVSDDRRFAFAEHLETIDAADRLIAYNAVIEGHAQHVTRRLAERHGWEADFARLHDLIGKVPPDLDPGSAEFARIFSMNFVFGYHEGERFFDVLVDVEGGVERAFREPPDASVLILHPEWYLDPASRPEGGIDLARLTARFDATFLGEGWTRQEMELNEFQLATAMGLLPEEARQRALVGYRQGRGAVFVMGAGERMVVFTFFELDDVPSADAFVVADERVNRLKDEQMRTGAIRIVESGYEVFERPGWRGFIARKRSEVQGQTVEIAAITAGRENLVVSVLYSAHPLPAGEIDRVMGAVEEALGR